MKIGFLGGGSIAKAVGALAQAVGHQVVLGVRNPAQGDAPGFTYGGFEDAIAGADIVVVALPFYVLDQVLPALSDALAGKLVIDATNPVGADWAPILTGEQSSGAEAMQEHLPRSRVAKAFNNIFADVLAPERIDRNGHKLTLFIASDDAAATQTIADLGVRIGLSPINAGPLKSARYLEAMAHLNIELAVGQGGGTNAAFLYDRQA